MDGSGCETVTGALVKAKVRHSNAGYCCCVPQCSNRSSDKTLHFHRFPADRNNRKRWCVAIRRDVGANFAITSHTRVCSAHFRPSDYIQNLVVPRLVRGVIPSVFKWSKPRGQRRILCRAQMEPKPKESSTSGTSMETAATVDCTTVQALSVDKGDLETPPPSRDHDYQLPAGYFPSRSEADAFVKVTELEEEVASLRGKSISLENISLADNTTFKRYTGLPNVKVFKALVKYLKPKVSRLKWWRGPSTLDDMSTPSQRRATRQYLCTLSVAEQLFFVLFRLRTGSDVTIVAHVAGCSASTFSKLFTTWVNFLAYELKAMHPFPTSRPRLLIRAFKKFPHVSVVLDCTEVFTKRPSGLLNRKHLFSTYKHHNTVKFLVGISPSGYIMYMSDMWGGRASDQYITRECGLLNKLRPGQEVMADRGFLIEDDLASRNIRLHIPSFLGRDRVQLSAGEVTQTRRIAEARIHVERAIRRIKEFKILSGEVALTMLHVLEQVMQVCAFLTNFQPPIVKEVVFMS